MTFVLFFCAPLLGEGAVEPLVPGGHEVAPLDDLERLLLRRRARREEEVRAHAGRERSRSRHLDEIAAAHAAFVFLLLHPILPDCDSPPSSNQK